MIWLFELFGNLGGAGGLFPPARVFPNEFVVASRQIPPHVDMASLSWFLFDWIGVYHWNLADRVETLWVGRAVVLKPRESNVDAFPKDKRSMSDVCGVADAVSV